MLFYFHFWLRDFWLRTGVSWAYWWCSACVPLGQWAFLRWFPAGSWMRTEWSAVAVQWWTWPCPRGLRWDFHFRCSDPCLTAVRTPSCFWLFQWWRGFGRTSGKTSKRASWYCFRLSAVGPRLFLLSAPEPLPPSFPVWCCSSGGRSFSK